MSTTVNLTIKEEGILISMRQRLNRLITKTIGGGEGNMEVDRSMCSCL